MRFALQTNGSFKVLPFGSPILACVLAERIAFFCFLPFLYDGKSKNDDALFVCNFPSLASFSLGYLCPSFLLVRALVFCELHLLCL